jgi:hypothetical protein
VRSRCYAGVLQAYTAASWAAWERKQQGNAPLFPRCQRLTALLHPDPPLPVHSEEMTPREAGFGGSVRPEPPPGPAGKRTAFPPSRGGNAGGISPEAGYPGEVVSLQGCRVCSLPQDEGTRTQIGRIPSPMRHGGIHFTASGRMTARAAGCRRGCTEHTVSAGA